MILHWHFLILKSRHAVNVTEANNTNLRSIKRLSQEGEGLLAAKNLMISDGCL